LLSEKLPAHSIWQKIAGQLHQQLKLQILSINWTTFCQICLPFAKHCAPRRASHPVRAKKPNAYVGLCTWRNGGLHVEPNFDVTKSKRPLFHDLLV